MIALASGLRVYLACGATDMRKGMEGLAMLVQQSMGEDPFGGAVFAFRGRRAGRRSAQRRSTGKSSRRSPRPQPRHAAGTPAALRSGGRRQARRVPVLRWCHALHRRTVHRAARHRAGAVARAGHAAAALRLPCLRGCRGGGAGAGAPGRRRHADRGVDRAYRGQQVLRFAAAVPAGADAGAAGDRAGSRHLVQLGGPGPAGG